MDKKSLSQDNQLPIIGCKYCNDFSYDTTLPGYPELLLKDFDYNIIHEDPGLWYSGIGKCKHCGAEIEFHGENLLYAKIRVTRKAKE